MSAVRENAGILIRDAADHDIAEVYAIYRHHVLTGSGSFEEIPPAAEEMARRRAAVQAQNLPYLVAELEGRVAGFAYVMPFRPRAAYRYTVENSIYVAPDASRAGVGAALLDRLIEICAKAGYRQMIAVIGDSGNIGSIRLHARAGFSHTGVLKSVGFKFGRWVDVVLMQRSLGPGDSGLPNG